MGSNQGVNALAHEYRSERCARCRPKKQREQPGGKVRTTELDIGRTAGDAWEQKKKNRLHSTGKSERTLEWLH